MTRTPAARRFGVAINASPFSRNKPPINFARLNHILIPETKEARDRFRSSRFGRVVAPLGWFYGALSEEGRVVAIASYLVGGLALDVPATDAHLLWAVIAGLVVASLLVRRWYRIPRGRLEASAPRRVTLGDAATVSLAFYNDGDEDLTALRVLGPFLPWDGKFVGKAPRLPRVAAHDVARGEVGVRFSQRGEHHFDPFRVCALVPLGLAVGAPVYAQSLKILVVPRIANVARLTTGRSSKHQPGGVPLASRTGESMDLLGVRPYRPGDPVRNLHARSWARAGIPVVREYQEEYFTRVGVIVRGADANGPAHGEVLEAMLSVAAGAVAFLTRGEGLIDLLVVGGRVHDLTLGRHLGFLEQALDLLACVKVDEEVVTADALVHALQRHLSRLSAVVVVSHAWDGGELAERVRGYGVACTSVVVTSGAATVGHGAHHGPPQAGPGVTTVDAAAVLRGEALAL